MKKYIITFLITSTIFLSAFFISDYINVSRVEQLQNVQEKISLNILATETRFALLSESSCENVFQGSQLETGITRDLNDLVTRIKFLENELGGDNEDVQLLKQRYTLLQIKDFLLVKELSEKCNYTIATVLYFYTDDCFECRKQSIVLDQIRSENNALRVYWMDSSVKESTLETLERLSGVEIYPTIVLGDTTYVDFQSYEDLKLELEEWADNNNALLQEFDSEYLLEQGIEFIKKELGYADVVSSKYENDIFTYEYRIDMEGGDGFSIEVIELEYQESEQLFNIINEIPDEIL